MNEANKTFRSILFEVLNGEIKEINYYRIRKKTGDRIKVSVDLDFDLVIEPADTIGATLTQESYDRLELAITKVVHQKE